MDRVKTQPPFPPNDIGEVLDATAGLWPDLREKRLFITGGTGFFGCWLLETLMAANQRFGLGVEATVLSRDPAAFARRLPHFRGVPEVSWVQGSAVDLGVERVAQALNRPQNGLTFDAVVHLTTEADNDRTLADPKAAIEVIAGSTRRALEFAAAVGARRFLFTSSGSAYGLQPPNLPRMSEDFPGAPDATDFASVYAISGSAKCTAEALCVNMGKSLGIETVIARCFAFSGPGLPMDGKFALGNFLADALAGRDIVVKGDGTPVRSYMYASDLTVWLWTLLCRGASGRTYNVGSEHAVTIRETAETIRREVAPQASVRVLTPPDASRPIHRYVPSTSRARDELGLQERVDLLAGIRRTAAWLTQAR